MLLWAERQFLFKQQMKVKETDFRLKLHSNTADNRRRKKWKPGQQNAVSMRINSTRWNGAGLKIILSYLKKVWEPLTYVTTVLWFTRDAAGNLLHMILTNVEKLHSDLGCS